MASRLPLDVWRSALTALLAPKVNQQATLATTLAELANLRFPLPGVLSVDVERLLDKLSVCNLTGNAPQASHFSTFTTNLLYHQDVRWGMRLALSCVIFTLCRVGGAVNRLPAQLAIASHRPPALLRERQPS